MTTNLHTHTPRCNHAWGSETEYVECALQEGLTVLGFSDHSPYVFPGEYYSHFRQDSVRRKTKYGYYYSSSHDGAADKK